jgi:hypothetical protein
MNLFENPLYHCSQKTQLKPTLRHRDRSLTAVTVELVWNCPQWRGCKYVDSQEECLSLSKKLWFTLLTGLVFPCAFLWNRAPQCEATTLAPYVKPVPSYAKWGKIALEAAKKRYPNSSIVDYEHVGRVEISDTVAEEVFKLWLVRGGRGFGLFVRVSFEKKGDRLLRIQFQETDR